MARIIKNRHHIPFSRSIINHVNELHDLSYAVSQLFKRIGANTGQATSADQQATPIRKCFCHDFSSRRFNQKSHTVCDFVEKDKKTENLDRTLWDCETKLRITFVGYLFRFCVYIFFSLILSFHNNNKYIIRRATIRYKSGWDKNEHWNSLLPVRNNNMVCSV